MPPCIHLDVLVACGILSLSLQLATVDAKLSLNLSAENLADNSSSVEPHCRLYTSSVAYGAARRFGSGPVDTDFWVTSEKDVEYAETRISRKSTEFRSLSKYFFRYMPKDTELMNIIRVENRFLFKSYERYRFRIHMDTLNSYPCTSEQWQWHGCNEAASRSIIRNGFKRAYSSMKFNVYGAGLYFAADPRLAHYFIREIRGVEHAMGKLILVRVVAGRVGKKEPLTWRNASAEEWKEVLGRPENRQAPPGYHSISSKDNIELVTFNDFSAYPAYVFHYTSPSLKDVNPYRMVEELGQVDEIENTDPFCRCPSSYKPVSRKSG